MNNELIRLKTTERSPLVQLLDEESKLRKIHPGVVELIHAHDAVWAIMPPALQDFILRFLKSSGLPIEYDRLPIWAEKAARHVFTLCFPTVRKISFSELDDEAVGRLLGHMHAISHHAVRGSGVFAKEDFSKVPEIMNLFRRMQEVIPDLIRDSLTGEPVRVAKFMKGVSFAYERTFDVFGMPVGWNTNSPVLFGVCLFWNSLRSGKMSRGTFRAELANMLGEQVTGTDERVNKILQRIGYRSTGLETPAGQGTAKVLTVPAQESGE